MLYRCGDFVLDTQERCLEQGNRRVSLRPRSFAVLRYLVERPQQLVEKSELLNVLWDGTLVTDNALTQSIKEVRQVLGDDAHHPLYIETVPRVGYRLIADVEQIVKAENGSAANSSAAPPEIPIDQTSPMANTVAATASVRRSRTKMLLATLVGAACLLLLLFSWWPSDSAEQGMVVQSLAVLPFANLTGNVEHDYLADGVTELLTTDLSKLGKIKVIAPASASYYRESPLARDEIARQLGVQVVVHGSVLRSERQIRVTARLEEAATGRMLWAESYQSPMRDMVSLQHDVCSDIAQQIASELHPDGEELASTDRPIDPAAYEAYLMGRYYFNKRTPAGFEEGIEYFQRAVDKQPDYALAYVGLADCWNLLCNYDRLPPKTAVPQAKAAAQQALDLDETLAEAHTSLAFALMHYDWDFSESERHFRRAIELNSNSAQAHHWYALCLMAQDRFEEGLAHMEQARSLDPLSLIINVNLGWLHYFHRDYDRAIRAYRQAIDMDSSFIAARVKLAWALQQVGKDEEAVAELERATKLAPTDVALKALLAETYAHAGQADRAREGRDQLERQAEENYVSNYWIAAICTALGDSDRALECLEQAYQQQSGWLVWAKVDPKLDSLRNKQRFQQLIRRIGLD